MSATEAQTSLLEPLTYPDSLTDSYSTSEPSEEEEEEISAESDTLSPMVPTLDLTLARSLCPVAQLDSKRQLLTPRVISNNEMSMNDRIHRFFPITSKTIEENLHKEWVWEFTTVLPRKQFHLDAMWKKAWSIEGNKVLLEHLKLGTVFPIGEIEKVDILTSAVTFETSVFQPSAEFIRDSETIWTFSGLQPMDYQMTLHVMKSGDLSKTLMFQLVPQHPKIKSYFLYCRGRVDYASNEADPVRFFEHRVKFTAAIDVGKFWNRITATKLYYRLHGFFVSTLANPVVGRLF